MKNYKPGFDTRVANDLVMRGQGSVSLDYRSMDTDVYAEDTSPSYFETEDYRLAVDEVGEYIKTNTVVTVADIVEALPQYQRVLFAVLDDLRNAGKVYWEEWRPIPTMIYAGDKRLPVESYQYNWRTARERTWKHRVQDLGTETACA